LAGISGTGKTNFVREQVKLSGDLDKTYALVAVRPDWHDPSDLLGYITRLGNEAEYVVTDVLEFFVRAWKDIADGGLSFDNGKLGWGNATPDEHEVRPFWLCLDEMNLAPIEQYFADYLSVLETRKWVNAAELAEGEPIYQCEALLKPQVIEQLSESRQQKLKADLKLAEPCYQKLLNYFILNGIPLPFNLIVAGTVNMDETTHGFSRKVIDRALTLDFGMFFPNDFAHFLKPAINPNHWIIRSCRGLQSKI
jgi:5-methylcytosine-specific restriction endonuclease McrBC GTP-binding regulatory subunit McrB